MREIETRGFRKSGLYSIGRNTRPRFGVFSKLVKAEHVEVRNSFKCFMNLVTRDQNSNSGSLMTDIDMKGLVVE